METEPSPRSWNLSTWFSPPCLDHAIAHAPGSTEADQQSIAREGSSADSRLQDAPASSGEGAGASCLAVKSYLANHLLFVCVMTHDVAISSTLASLAFHPLRVIA